MLAGCAEPTEEEQLAAFREGLTYRTYRMASESGLLLAAKTYAISLQLGEQQGIQALADAPEVTPQQICLLRAALNFGALAASKNEPALAEADLIHDDPACGVLERNVATGTRAVLFSRLQWPKLSAQQVEVLRHSPSALGEDHAQMDLIALHGTLAMMALQNKDMEAFERHVRDVAVFLEMPWIGNLARMALAAKEKRIEDVLREIKAMSNDPTVPEGVRKELRKLIDDIEAQVGDIDAPALTERVVTLVLWELIKEKGRAQWGELLDRAERFETAPWLDAARSGQKLERINGTIDAVYDGLMDSLRDPADALADAPADASAEDAPSGEAR